MSAQIELTHGYVAFVDEADYATLSQHKWHAFRVLRKGISYGVYAVRRKWDGVRQSSILMHRQIMAAPKGLVVDHIDGNQLNNHRENLRIATHAENLRNRQRVTNRTGYKGVRETDHGFVAYINVDRRRKSLGTHPTAELAAAAYDKAAVELHGVFASTNAEIRKRRTQQSVPDVAQWGSSNGRCADLERRNSQLESENRDLRRAMTLWAHAQKGNT